MMSPAATVTEPIAKPGAFDVATLFLSNKAVRDDAALSLAATAKKEGVEFFASIQFTDAIVKVSP